MHAKDVLQNICTGTVSGDRWEARWKWTSAGAGRQHRHTGWIFKSTQLGAGALVLVLLGSTAKKEHDSPSFSNGRTFASYCQTVHYHRTEKEREGERSCKLTLSLVELKALFWIFYCHLAMNSWPITESAHLDPLRNGIDSVCISIITMQILQTRRRINHRETEKGEQKEANFACHLDLMSSYHGT